MIYTVDASVWLNAFNPYEDGHGASRELLSRLRDDAVPIAVPTLVLPEVAAAVSRGREDADLARRFVAALARLPQLILVAVDTKLAHQSGDVAAEYRLRGSDAVFAAVALRFGSVLVTRDGEQLRRLADVVEARSPEEELARMAKGQ